MIARNDWRHVPNDFLFVLRDRIILPGDEHLHFAANIVPILKLYY
jgi:hypothetical protein